MNRSSISLADIWGNALLIFRKAFVQRYMSSLWRCCSWVFFLIWLLSSLWTWNSALKFRWSSFCQTGPPLKCKQQNLFFPRWSFLLHPFITECKKSIWTENLNPQDFHCGGVYNLSAHNRRVERSSWLELYTSSETVDSNSNSLGCILLSCFHAHGLSDKRAFRCRTYAWSGNITHRSRSIAWPNYWITPSMLVASYLPSNNYICLQAFI